LVEDRITILPFRSAPLRTPVESDFLKSIALRHNTADSDLGSQRIIYSRRWGKVRDLNAATELIETHEREEPN
jgi:hypothetical protein